jgi:hypothetical protein
MGHPSLYIFKPMAGAFLVPMPVEELGHDPELDDEIAREVLLVDLAALLPPESEQGIFVIAHDDAGI